MAKTVVSDLLQIFKSSVSAVLPEKLIRRSINYNPATEELTLAGERYNVKNKNVYLVGTGKAVQSMAMEVENTLGSKIKHGIISIPVGSLNSDTKSKNVHYYEGAKNNLPDSNAENTSRKVKHLVTGLTDTDILLVLISGGGSALLTLPKPPISLNEKIDLIKKLANSGADIKELNTVRKKLSDIKGGRLALLAQPALVVSLILSDIVGDPLDLIASGPTVKNQDKPSKANSIISKYKLNDNLPKSMITELNESEEGNPFPENNVKNFIIGSNKISTEAAVEEARSLNYVPLELSNAVTGDLKVVAKEYATLTMIMCKFLTKKLDKNSSKEEICKLNIPGLDINVEDLESIGDKGICLILGGEITVEVKGIGKGGRNQQLALEFSHCISNMKREFDGFEVYILSAGTDGIDGPTDAAGAIGYLDLVTDATKEGLDVNKYLEENNSYNFYKQFKSGCLHVITGHTNTNVMDIHLIIIRRSKNSNSKDNVRDLNKLTT